MSSATEFHIKGFTATAAIIAYVAVKLDGTTANSVVVATVGDTAIGVTMANADAAGIVPVRLFNGQGTALVMAGAALAIHSAVRVISTAGKIDDTLVGPVIGFALGAATATGDIVEVLLKGNIVGGYIASASDAAVTALLGTLTGTVAGTIVNVAATAAGTAGGATPTAAQVDTGVAAAVAPIVTSTNLALKELQTTLASTVTLANQLRADLILAGVIKGAA